MAGTLIAVAGAYDCLATSAAEMLRGPKVLKMLKITKEANGEVVFTVCGRLGAENLADLKSLFSSEARGSRITLDLKDLTHVDQEAVRFLERCEVDNIQLNNCPAYIREWITRERDQR